MGYNACGDSSNGAIDEVQMFVLGYRTFNYNA